MRPRVLTSMPAASAHFRMALVSVWLDEVDLRRLPPTLRPWAMKSLRLLRSRLALRSERSISHSTPSSAKRTVSAASEPSMSSCKVVKTFVAMVGPASRVCADDVITTGIPRNCQKSLMPQFGNNLSKVRKHEDLTAAHRVEQLINGVRLSAFPL